MVEEFVREAERALSEHGDFEERDDGFAVTTTPFDAKVRVEGHDGAARYHVTVRVPTLNAVVVGEEVGETVREGWLETFERRLEHPGGALRSDPEPPRVTLDEAAAEVVVEAAFRTGIPARGAEDAAALVNFVEGTYLQGVVPGYEYRDPVSQLIARAEERSGASGGVPPL